MPESTSAERVLLDTSVVIDLEKISVELLLDAQVAISAITLAELSAGPAAARDPSERALRQHRLQRVEAVFEVIDFGPNAARAYGRIAAAVHAAGRKPRGRTADLMIASVAVAEGLTLYTRNPGDFVGLEDLLSVVAV